MTTLSASRTISLAAAARELHTTPLHLLMHLKRGILTGEETADGWRIDVDSLAILARNRQTDTSTVVCQSACSKGGGCGSCGS